MPRDNLLYLAEIVEAIDRISRWLGGVDEDGWDSSAKLAAVSAPRCAEQHPDVPWRRIADFRNVAVHQYFAIEWSLV
jgi:uncharacterized protein with HEPN domain